MEIRRTIRDEQRIIQVRTRRVRMGPEQQLLLSALKTEFLFRHQLPAVFFHEPELPTGLPDLVAVYLSTSVPSLCPSRLRLRNHHVRVLHHLHRVGSSSGEELSHLLHIDGSRLATLLADLRDAGLVSIGDVVRPQPLRRAFFLKHIVAIEAKISNWSRALVQAAANCWFASHSYILVPPSRALHRIMVRSQELGVGVLVLQNGKIQVAKEPRVRAIPASYGSWLFNEWALRAVEK